VISDHRASIAFSDFDHHALNYQTTISLILHDWLRS
jgi:hypothetical protein